MTWLRRLLQACPEAFLLAFPLLALAQAPVMPPSPFPDSNSLMGAMDEPKNLEQLDQALEILRNAVWVLPGAMGNRAAGPQDPDIAEELSQIVLQEDARNAIAEARAAAASAIARDPTADPVPLLKPVVDLVRAEFARVTLLVMSWSVPEIRQVHMRYLDPMLARASEEDRGRYRARIAAAEEGVKGLRDAAAGPRPAEALLGGGASASFRTLWETYNAVRLELVASGATVPARIQAFRERDTHCPVPSSPKAYNSSMSLREAADPTLFYPPEMQRYNIEGLVRVEIQVSPEGCVTGARTITSSGVPELDAAAEKLAFETMLFPASVAGKAIAAVSVLPVRFQLLD